MNKIQTGLLLITVICCAAGPLYSAEAGDETSPQTSGPGMGPSRELNVSVTSVPEIKLGFTQHFVFPFLQGDTSLTANNNIALALTAEVTPVSLTGLAEVVWTPIAFFQLAAGGSIGSGWNINLFGKDKYGIGLNRDDGSGRMEHSGSSFDGLLWKLQTGAVLQFDLAALIPGDWNHVVARSYHEINYRGYTGASSHESWYHEHDYGENINGVNYYGNLLVGYQMPKLTFLNMAGLMAEGTLFFYDTPNRSQWGDDRIDWHFSAFAGFTITKRISALVAVQFKTQRNYTDSNAEDLYYQNRHLDSSDPLSLKFHRVAANFTFVL